MELNFLYIVISIVVILVSLIFHEIAHGFVAYKLGDDTAKLSGRLTLNPIKHIDPFLTIVLPLFLASVGAPVFGGAKPVPFNPKNVRGGEWGVALVALAGPAINFLLAFISFWLLITINPSQDWMTQLFLSTTYINLGLFVFNLIPIPPLDGSRLLYALAPDFAKGIMEKMEQFGIFIVLIIVFFMNSAIVSLMTSAINLFLNLFRHIFGV